VGQPLYTQFNNMYQVLALLKSIFHS